MSDVLPTPAHIQSLCEGLNGKQLVHIASKTITQSDLDGQQSRLRLPKSSGRAIQQYILSLNQQAAANFLSISDMESMIEINFLTEEDIRSSRALEGVAIKVFVFSPGESRRQGEGILKRWNCGTIVIHGMNAMRSWIHLNEGDKVELWGFKDEQNQLYLAIDKSIESSK